jgi:hypothetical protein
MSVLVQDRVVIAPPYHELSVLVEEAARDVREDMIAASEEPLTTLSTRESCTSVQSEFAKQYERLVWHL